MQKLTRITLSTGEMAIYLDGWYPPVMQRRLICVTRNRHCGRSA